MGLEHYIKYKDDKKERHSSVEAMIDINIGYSSLNCYGWGADEAEAKEDLMDNIQPILDIITERKVIDSFHGDYRFLSNFWESDITYDNGIYPTVEHAFQAAKTLDVDENEAIRQARTPGEAKRMGQKCTLRPDWDDVKIQTMRACLMRKFSDPILYIKLLETDPHALIEGNAWGDKFWGVCPDDSNFGITTGKNHLGVILMEIRNKSYAEIREELKRDKHPLPVAALEILT